MSDQGRKDFSQKIHEKAKPESQKTFGEKTKEKASNAADSVSRAVQPNSEKSNTQKAADKLHNDNKTL
ncbi:heat shock 9/12 family protein [Ascoidea rubescens DSM 1968]|uniref:Heat shock protein 9/12 n=1 Tax=Ascoidea rubescens DSM 1968 TaxID=1344418 RepID=A0A1D2VDA7_9ASCO|nr:heat shock protein 9/12 [Ascoidea rubescens DSM 1968]ODV59684.1 heat shock protein 9/12 [Ascoidea rubescens DSM 1968]